VGEKGTVRGIFNSMWQGGSNFEQIDVVCNHFYKVVDKGRVTLRNEHYIPYIRSSDYSFERLRKQ